MIIFCSFPNVSYQNIFFYRKLLKENKILNKKFAIILCITVRLLSHKFLLQTLNILKEREKILCVTLTYMSSEPILF